MLLAHPASTAYGLNLQAGGHIIVWFGLTWSLEHYQQANARLYRQGQERPVVIHHLVAKGTVDEHVMKALSTKAAGQEALLEAMKATIRAYVMVPINYCPFCGRKLRGGESDAGTPGADGGAD